MGWELGELRRQLEGLRRGLALAHELAKAQGAMLEHRNPDDGGAAYAVQGYQLGHYTVATDAAGGDVAVPTLEAGVQLIQSDGTLAARPATLRLDDLKQRIRALDRSIDRPVR